MDIKLKSYKTNFALKLLATLLCMASMTGVFFGLTNQLSFDFTEGQAGYLKSSENARDLTRVYNDAYSIAFEYKSIEWIKAGNLVSADALAEKKNQLVTEKNDKINDLYEQYNNWIERAKDSQNKDEVQRLTNERQTRITELTNQYVKLSENALATLIEDDQQIYQSRIKSLNTSGYDYLITFQDGHQLSNRPSLMGHTTQTASALYTSYIGANQDRFEAQNPNIVFSMEKPPTGNSILVALPDTLLSSKMKAYDLNHAKSQLGLKVLLGSLVVFALSLIYLLVSAGHVSGTETTVITLNLLDRLFLDIGLFMTFGGIAGCMVMLTSIWNSSRDLYANYLYTSPLVCSGTLLGIYWVTSAAKRLKRKEFLKHTLVVFLFSNVVSTFKNMLSNIVKLLHRGPAAQKAFRQLLFYVSANVACGLLGIVFIQASGSVGFLIAIALLGLVNYLTFLKLVKKYDAFDTLVWGTERIKSGDLQHRIPLQEEFGLDVIADSINNIAEGLKNSVDSEVRAERMKAELITNVSHDLKTPLTAIITYVDLLKTEGLDSENALSYLDVLDQKSQRLKNLTDDLFEAAKASSGNIPVQISDVDLCELLTQGLGELSDQIEQSGLDFIINLPKERLMVQADGKLLWRVMENLLSNVFKYALPGSRVYLDASSKDDRLCISLKNISQYSLNMPVEELMERFKRGDASRSSDGSGLGLSIARSLTEIQGGHFDLNIDGDLFKASICFIQSNNRL